MRIWKNRSASKNKTISSMSLQMLLLYEKAAKLLK